MSRAMVIGAVGAIVGAVTAIMGIVWSFVAHTFLLEINIYLLQLSYYLSAVVPGTGLYGSVPHPILYYPTSGYLFGIYSFILSVLLVSTGIMIGVGFYDTYLSGGRTMGLAVFIFSILGTASSALLIIMGNLTTGYNFSAVATFPAETFVSIPVPTTPNFSLN
ncbi:MAG: hypothetical protein QXS27_00415 [Candidatus Jordarchaeaceae archaeon]